MCSTVHCDRESLVDNNTVCPAKKVVILETIATKSRIISYNANNTRLTCIPEKCVESRNGASYIWAMS